MAPRNRLRSARRPDAGASGAMAGGEEAWTVLDRVRVEVTDLHATILGLQGSLGPALAVAAAADATLMETGQTLDLVAQSLDGLSTFLGAVSRLAEGSGGLDVAGAAELVRLEGLSSRLAGGAPRGADPEVRGDVELF